MQSKKLFFIALFSIILAYALGTRLLNRNSVFNPENFVKKEGEKIDDLLEKQRLSQRVANQIKNKKGLIKPEIIPSNSTANYTPEEVYNINYVCPDGQYFNNYLGKCVELSNNKTETMISQHRTQTKSRLEIATNNTIACLNTTADKYDDKVVDLNIIPGKKE